jgi:hypothetical protein
VIGGLSGDEESAPDLPRMEPLDVVEQVHHFELRERDAQLEQRFGEASAQDPMDASLGIDQPARSGSLPLHHIFIPPGGDSGVQNALEVEVPSFGATRQGSV